MGLLQCLGLCSYNLNLVLCSHKIQSSELNFATLCDFRLSLAGLLHGLGLCSYNLK